MPTKFTWKRNKNGKTPSNLCSLFDSGVNTHCLRLISLGLVWLCQFVHRHWWLTVARFKDFEQSRLLPLDFYLERNHISSGLSIRLAICHHHLWRLALLSRLRRYPTMVISQALIFQSRLTAGFFVINYRLKTSNLIRRSRCYPPTLLCLSSYSWQVSFLATIPCRHPPPP